MSDKLAEAVRDGSFMPYIEESVARLKAPIFAAALEEAKKLEFGPVVLTFTLAECLAIGIDAFKEKALKLAMADSILAYLTAFRARLAGEQEFSASATHSAPESSQ